jgi:hypothetical protein
MDMIPAYLTEEEERANIRHTTELIERATGKRPSGWISPRSTPSLRSPRLLAEAGYDWHGDTLNDDLPYLVRFPSRSIVAFPNNTEVNDLPLYMRHGNSPRVYVEIFEDWLKSVRERETGAVRMDPAVHTHVFGRQPGLAMYERVIEIAKPRTTSGSARDRKPWRTPASSSTNSRCNDRAAAFAITAAPVPRRSEGAARRSFRET